MAGLLDYQDIINQRFGRFKTNRRPPPPPPQRLPDNRTTGVDLMQMRKAYDMYNKTQGLLGGDTATTTANPVLTKGGMQSALGGGANPALTKGGMQSALGSSGGGASSAAALGSYAAAIPVFAKFVDWAWDKDAPGGGLGRKNIHILEDMSGATKGYAQDFWDTGVKGFKWLGNLF